MKLGEMHDCGIKFRIILVTRSPSDGILREIRLPEVGLDEAVSSYFFHEIAHLAHR